MAKTWIIGGVLALGFAACGDTDNEIQRPPQEPDVQETQIPGQVFTRGPEGEVVARATYRSKKDVTLVGTGLVDGEYYFQITTPDCMLLLAGPGPQAGSVPDTASKVIDVTGGVFAPIALAPFNTTSDEAGAYEVYVTPVREFLETGEGCFGFSDVQSAMTRFVVEEGAPGSVTDTTEL